MSVTWMREKSASSVSLGLVASPRTRVYPQQYATETDPVMRRQCRKRAMQYHNLALEESKPELRAGKKHYALFRVMGAVTVVLLTILAAVAACSHFFPELNMSAIGRI